MGKHRSAHESRAPCDNNTQVTGHRRHHRAWSVHRHTPTVSSHFKSQSSGCTDHPPASPIHHCCDAHILRLFAHDIRNATTSPLCARARLHGCSPLHGLSRGRVVQCQVPLSLCRPLRPHPPTFSLLIEERGPNVVGADVWHLLRHLLHHLAPCLRWRHVPAIVEDAADLTLRHCLSTNESCTQEHMLQRDLVDHVGCHLFAGVVVALRVT